MDAKIQKNLKDFYFDLLPIKDFEKWLYEDKALEALMNPDDYLALISLNYNDNEDIKKAKELVRRFYNESEKDLIYKHRAFEIARFLEDSSITLKDGCEQLAEMANSGAKFIPLAFVGYDSEFKDAERAEWFDFESAYGERIKEDARKLAEQLMRYK